MSSDQSQRDRATRMTSQSFAVEASAGTGKTSTLVSRILRLVLDDGPGGEPLHISAVCAITFTEKAAGEMKVRLRQELEKAGARDDLRGERAREALRELDSAMISTFHSFAVSLLKERPVEAGLDPRFTALDDLQSGLFFLEVWEPWLDQALRDRCEPLEAALRQGINLEQIRDLASTLRTHASVVRRLHLVPPESDANLAARVEELRREGDAYRNLIEDPTDKLVAPLMRALTWLAGPESGAAQPVTQRCGKGGNWNGKRATVESVRDFVRRVHDFAAHKARLSHQRIFWALSHWLVEEFVPCWEKAKRASGTLDFDDQLEAARRLLSRSRAARREFQKRYATLLVDEFQDTDPVQLEIVLLLSTSNLDETDPAKIQAAPGRLFIVGDPKQSIYRFRGADVETYQKLAESAMTKSLGLERLELTKNYRSVPSILRFVDKAFEGVMTRQGHYQSEYLPFGDEGERKAKTSTPAVQILGDRTATGEIAGSGTKVFQLEAARIARLVAKIRGSTEWMVEEAAGDKAVERVPRWGDIAILLPVLSRAELLEDEFRRAGIPYVLEGGKFYYTRSEVASAITLLRAIGNPNDQIALYGSLRSIFFGLSDEDLLRAKVAGIPLDYRFEPPADSLLCRPYGIMRELHRRCHERPASETLEALFQQTGAREVLAARGYQSLANLGKLVRQLRMLQHDMTYAEILSLLVTIDEEQLSESESRLMEEQSDAVRILTIHKAKGLDFRIVILGCLGVERGQHNVSFLADPHGRGTFALKVGSKEDGWSTPEWEEIKEEEKKREEAELLRLLYVAMTRARDHLVISVHTKGTTDKATGVQKAGFTKTRLAPIAGFLNKVAKGDGSLARFLDVGALDRILLPGPAESQTFATDFGAVLRREYSELEKLLSETPHSARFATPRSLPEDPSHSAQAAGIVRSRAVRHGVAFHEAMESVDFELTGDASRTALDAGRRNQLDDIGIRTLEEMMNRCLSSSLIDRARRAAASGGRLMREMSYIRPVSLDSAPVGLEEGRIDLLFEERGRWILVDYKTDQIPSEVQDTGLHFREKYREQIEQYAGALASVGVNVDEAYLLLARTGEEVPILG